MVWRWDQAEPFGSNPADENPSGLGAFDLPLRLPGQYFDKETNLHYNYFRDYDPSIGRYEQSDPMGLQAGLNTYAYVRSNPLRYRDPSGLQYSNPFGEMAGGAAAVGFGGAWQAGVTDRSAAETAAQSSGLTGPHNGPQDALRHCIWSCLMSRSIGAIGAKRIGDIHEQANNQRGQQRSEEAMDQANNAAGRNCSNLPGTCPDLCADKYLSGGLFGPGGIPFFSSPMSPTAEPGGYDTPTF